MTPSPTIAPPNEAPLEDSPGSPFDTVRRFRHALTPFPRAGLFYVRSWANWLRHRGDDGVPAPFPSLLLTGHAFADEAVIAGFRVTKAPSPVSSVLRAELEARAAFELYAERGFLVDPASFHPAPPGIEKPTARWDRTRHLRYERLSFESRYEPFDGEPGRERWVSSTSRTARDRSSGSQSRRAAGASCPMERSSPTSRLPGRCAASRSATGCSGCSRASGDR